jgi:hypothetical protein
MLDKTPSKATQSATIAIANNIGSRGISRPAPSSAPIQFTLEDAQQKWLQWYKSANVSRERIEQYIYEKKRGWAILKQELLRPPVDNSMDDEIENETDVSDDMDEGIEEQDMLVDQVLPVNNIVPQVPYTIHSDDQEMYKHIIDKQSKDISTSDQKLVTDTVKFNVAASRARTANEEQHNQLLMPLNSFFRKNSPPGYNTSVEMEDDEGKYNEYQYDVRSERDFTFGLSEESQNSRREHTDYFRAPFAHKHILRQKFEHLLNVDIKKKHPGKKDSIKSKQVYVSFNVEESDNKLKIMGVEPYSNNNMLGSKTGKTIIQKKIKVAGHDLILWVNADSAGHQSRYNASAIVPNHIQFLEIIHALKINNTVEEDPTVNIEEKSFRSSTRKTILASPPDVLPTTNYKRDMLNDRRQLITSLSGIINAKVKNKYLRAIVADEKVDFAQYPCLVLEPLPNYGKDFEVEPKNMMDELKEHIVFAFHDRYDISLGNRGSFGFAYPSVGDVAVSVRIWPGLIPATTFSFMMLEVLKNAGLLNEFENKFDKKNGENAPLINALKLAIIRAQTRFQRFLDIKKSQQTPLIAHDTYKWVNNRITSNVIKAQELVKKLSVKTGNLELIKRAVRTLENLNEYDLIQAGVEEQQSKVPEQQRKTDLSTAFKKRTLNRQVEDYELISETICSSGMDAYRIAIQTVGDTKSESSRLYFETAKVNKEIAERSHGIKKFGSITKLQDPSYNFVGQKDLQSDVPYTWNRSPEFASVHLYDITNTPIEEAFSKSLEQEPSFIVLFESLSKHFQFGMDKTTIGRLIAYVKTSRKDRPKVKPLVEKFGELKDTPLPNYFMNYMAMQNELFGE